VSPELRDALQGFTRRVEDVRKAPEFAPLGELEHGLQSAMAEAYRKRSAVYRVWMHPEFHELAAEAAQQWAELMQATADRPAPRRGTDGTAPSLRTVFGYDVALTGEVDRFAWDTGPEPVAPFTFDFITAFESEKP
jgi:hypothetical protein